MITNPITSPVRSCKLFIRNGETTRMYYEVHVNESRSTTSKIETVKIGEFKSRNAVEVYAFLNKQGIPSGEVQHAAVTMDNLGHNVANFGWFGGFIASAFDGVLQ